MLPSDMDALLKRWLTSALHCNSTCRLPQCNVWKPDTRGTRIRLLTLFIYEANISLLIKNLDNVLRGSVTLDRRCLILIGKKKHC